MLGPFELVLNSAVVLLLPIVIASLISGSKPPETGIFTKYYRAQKNLMFVGNLFLLSICAHAIARLAAHFGLIGEAAMDALMLPLGLPFFALLVAFGVLWFMAVLKIRRDGRTHQ